ncbi:unannotated protein [freshwater metagenome]|uniref:Unannotated protein n=1 Tax=freshwater metagenome TaxID=449393 RepID=A0A6J7KFI8_9ZZZZ|nr:hypothetical protein [Actinomycetota bacterium]
MSTRPATAAVVALACVAAGGALTGCETTQEKSAAIGKRAAAVDVPGRVRIGRPSPEVRLVAKTELRGEEGNAVVVELQNTGPRALVRYPVALRTIVAGRPQYANDFEGGDELLLRVPVIPPRGRVTWVNAGLPPAAEGAKLAVVLGSPIRRSRRPAAELAVSELQRSTEDSGPEGVAVTGVVRNPLRREQTEVPVYVTVREGGRITAAGATRIASIPARSTAPFEAVLVGDGRTGRLAAQALPTKLPTTRSSR